MSNSHARIWNNSSIGLTLSRGMSNKFRRKRPSCSGRDRPSNRLSRTKKVSDRRDSRERSSNAKWSKIGSPECKVPRKSASRVRCALLITSKDKRAQISDSRKMSFLKEKLN